MPVDLSTIDLSQFPPHHRLRHYRLLCHLTMEEVCDATGLDITTLRNLEYGRRSPLYKTLETIAGFYGVSLERLMMPRKQQKIHQAPHMRVRRLRNGQDRPP